MLSKDVAELAAMLPAGCPVCGAANFAFSEVLWPDLIDAWELNAEEVHYINLQQGFFCRNCLNNLRALTLARAICHARNFEGTLDQWASTADASRCRVLEINHASLLTKHLKTVPGHILVAYPDADIHALRFPDDSFDLVVHSDTLEHVQHPVNALAECRRVLKLGGALAFTVPMLVGRMTRSRRGLPPSYHGDQSDLRSDYIVETEFGADTPAFVLAAGFPSVTMFADLYPASVAFMAQK